MKINKKQNASTLLATLMTILVLAIIMENVFESATATNSASYQSSSWDEALNAAESGADLGMSVVNNIGTNGTSAWAGWSKVLSTGTTTGTSTYSSSVPSHLGNGNQKMYFTVSIDNSLTSNGNTWYRIRSVGTAELPGQHRVSYDGSVLDINGVKNHKSMLRGFSYTADITNGYCHLPQVSRKIEVIASPPTASLFLDALAAQSWVSLSGGEYIDSFNSSNPLYSTNGQYDPTKREQNATVAINSSGNGSDFRNSLVYGNAESNSGAIKNTGGVTGTISNNFQTTFPPVTIPSWASSPSVVYTSVTGPGTLTSGSGATPAYYNLSQVNLSGGNNLTITNPTPGQTSYVDIIVTGQLQLSGGATIIQQPGVVVTVYAESQVQVSGAGFENENNVASDLTIYGVGNNQQFQVSGAGSFIGVVYAPQWSFQLSGGASFSGALVANTADLSGGAGFHYDQALAGASSGGSQTYQMGSWVEDTRWQ